MKESLTRRTVTSMQLMGAPWWSLMTRMVIPVAELLTAIRPSAAPLRSMKPASKQVFINKMT